MSNTSIKNIIYFNGYFDLIQNYSCMHPQSPERGAPSKSRKCCFPRVSLLLIVSGHIMQLLGKNRSPDFLLIFQAGRSKYGRMGVKSDEKWQKS